MNADRRKHRRFLSFAPLDPRVHSDRQFFLFDGFMQTRICHHARHSGHRGFSLVELLIVMAVLAAVAGLTLPAMRGPLDKSRLTSAARQVQAALAKARSLAIRESAVVQVRYEIAGDRFLIERLPLQQQLNITVLDEAGGTMNSPSGLTEQPSPAANAASEVSSDPFKSGTMPDPDELTGTVILREGQLPSGVTFGELAPQQTSESTPITQPAATSDVNLISNSRWSEPVMFQPTGRTSDRPVYYSLFAAAIPRAHCQRFGSPERTACRKEGHAHDGRRAHHTRIPDGFCGRHRPHQPLRFAGVRVQPCFQLRRCI